MTTRAQTAARALPLIDLTNLNDDCTQADIDALCAKARTPHGNTAAVCVYPRFVAQSVGLLQGSGIKVATVVNFPDGGTDIRTTMRETKQAVGEGADEIDLVLPYHAFINGSHEDVEHMVTTIRAATDGTAVLKIILETGALKEDSLITAASHFALAEGADFIKTSTGKVAVNATPHAARLMLESIADFGDRTKGFKAAGGIKTVEDCGVYLALADEIMGPDWVSQSTFRFGASGVLADVIAALDGEASAQPTQGY